jgi:hypothetical protein
MEVLHDWADEQCVAILSAIRRAAPDSATVLVVEDLNLVSHAGSRLDGHVTMARCRLEESHR